MPSPVIPSDFCDLKPTPSTSPCAAIKTLFFDLPDLWCTFMSWMFNADGTLSDAFKREVNAVPAGTIVNFGGLTVPAGFLYCNGGAYKQADYPYLYAAIGVRFGVGNGVDEFQVPNCGGRVVVGVSPTEGYSLAQTGGDSAPLLTADQMPPIPFAINPSASTAISGDAVEGNLGASEGINLKFVTTQESTKFASTVDLGDAQQPIDVLMPFIVLTPCIKV